MKQSVTGIRLVVRTPNIKQLVLTFPNKTNLQVQVRKFIIAQTHIHNIAYTCGKCSKNLGNGLE